MSKLMHWLDEQTRPKMSAKDIADRVKVHQSLVTMWRSGLRKPGKGKLRELSKLTGIKVEDLL